MRNSKSDKIALQAKACGYCYMRGDKAVFLDRKDNDIRVFDSFEEAHKYAMANIHLIDRGSK